MGVIDHSGLAPQHFDVCGPLPGPGVTVLEASAGTGKTFTIAALVTRMVAEGVVPLSAILVVTFTRMATGELRERVRQSLAVTESALGVVVQGRSVAGTSAPGPETTAPVESATEGSPGTGVPGAGAAGGDSGRSPLVDLLSRGPLEVVQLRRRRLADALAGFDAATVTTTHGFCHTVLGALGVRGEVATGPALLEDPGDLVNEVVDDLFVRHALRWGSVPFRRSEALEAGRQAVANPATPLGPAADRADSTAAGLRRRLAQAVRVEVDNRLFDANLLTYDGLLARLAATLARPGGRGELACERLRQRYQAVLVDEFQDTDPTQWDIVRRAFADGGTTLVLIGDPKQAVYAFRGADIFAYLEAAATAGPGARFTLERNWRSDLALLEAYSALMTPLQLGHPDIRYRRALATGAHRRRGIAGLADEAPLRARLLDRAGPAVQRTSKGLAQKGSALRLIATDLANDVVRLLSSGAQLVSWDEEGAAIGLPRPVAPGHIGVLVRTNRQATLVQEALREAGVPVALAGAESVLSTPAARHWASLLEALEQPTSRSLAVALALTPFIGMPAAQVALAGEETWEDLHDQLQRWALVGRAKGIASLYAEVAQSRRLPARLLGEIDGERQLTDLGHIAELLHAEASQAQLGLAALRAWLARRTEEAAFDGTEAEQRSRRLDSGSDAVQLLTVHRAKGLEFPVVYCPYLWDAGWRDKAGGPVVFHDPDDAHRRKLDVGGAYDDPLYQRHYDDYQAEKRGEDLRLLYVALTRARHQAVFWWAGAQDCQHSALGRLLLARDGDGAVRTSGLPRVPKDAEVRAVLQRLAASAPGLISVEDCGRPGTARWAGLDHADHAVELAAARFDRPLDDRWRRSSYTSITSGAHGGAGAELVSSEPEDAGTADEPTSAGAEGAGAEGAGAEGAGAPHAPLSLLATMPAGAEVGTFIHRVLEMTDFAAPDLRQHLVEVLAGQELAYPGDVDGLAAVADGLAAAIEAPLGPAVGNIALRDIERRDRLDELSFELPVAGGEDARGEVQVADIARLLSAHLGGHGPLAGYPEQLARLEVELRGYLTGSLDLVFRVGGGPGRQRYFVADYKTNRLAPTGEVLTTAHYRPASLAAEMQRAHYPLQAILYMVALHRYLRWRLPGYRPALHLGGVVYLFLRGMAGPAPATASVLGPSPARPVAAVHEPEGVFAWQPPVTLVTELSDLLAGQR